MILEEYVTDKGKPLMFIDEKISVLRRNLNRV